MISWFVRDGGRLNFYLDFHETELTRALGVESKNWGYFPIPGSGCNGLWRILAP
jgi:hypothetical protein